MCDIIRNWLNEMDKIFKKLINVSSLNTLLTFIKPISEPGTGLDTETLQVSISKEAKVMRTPDRVSRRIWGRLGSLTLGRLRKGFLKN